MDYWALFGHIVVGLLATIGLTCIVVKLFDDDGC